MDTTENPSIAIFIENCDDCIASDHTGLNICKLNKTLLLTELKDPKKETHKNCPLKQRTYQIVLRT
jgi:hypothetical protein